MADQETPKAVIQAVGNELFIGTTPGGHALVFDADHEGNSGATPVDLLMIAVGACTAVDIVSILEKKRQKVIDYRVEVTGERHAEHPRYFEKFFVKHIITGINVDPEAVERAIELSDEKYCSVAATVKPKAQVLTNYEIIEKSPSNHQQNEENYE